MARIFFLFTLLALVCAVLCMLSTPCGASATALEVCVQPATIKLRQNYTCQDQQSSTPPAAVQWDAMRGEGVHSQVVVIVDAADSSGGGSDADPPIVGDVVMTWTDLVGASASIPAANMSAFQVGYVDCHHTTRYSPSGGGWRPDPLFPLAPAQPVGVQPGRAQPLWLTLEVPAATPAGAYSGQVTVVYTPHATTRTAATATGTTVVVPVTITVYDFVLPTIDNAQFDTVFSFSIPALDKFYGQPPNSPVNLSTQTAWLDFLAAHRVPGDDLYIHEPRPWSVYETLAAQGQHWMNLLDVSNLAAASPHDVIPGFDAAARTGSRRKRLWGGPEGTCYANYSDAYVTKMLDTLEPTVAKLQAAGTLHRAYVYGFDEAPPSCRVWVDKLYGAVKKRWPLLRTMATLNWHPMPTDLPLDAWVIQYEEYNATQTAPWLAAGKHQWWYHCIEPSAAADLNTFIERPLIQARLLFWLAAAHNVSGWLYYADDLWRGWPHAHTSPMTLANGTARSAWDPANYIWLPRTDIFANGDGYFTYPGTQGALGTVRLAAIRDGLEDVELFRALGAKRSAPLLARLVRTATDWTADPSLLASTRRQALQMLASS